MGCEYSNTNYLLAGLALERATGRGMAELLHEYIFDPLGMADTYYAATEATPEQARGYIRLDGDFVDATEWDNPQAAWATGCILSTVADQLKFVTAMKEVDRGGNELLGADSLAQQLDFRALGVDSDTEYGLGIARQEVEGHEVWGHSGGTLAYRAGTYWLPLEDIVVIGFSNWRHGDLESLLIAAVECFDPDE
jgi:D-alanyl-D-alanine carboxypeptidase